MNVFYRVVMAVLLSVMVLTPGATLAQDENWVCGEGPNDILVAAQTALDNGDLDRAMWLAARGEALCRNDQTLFQNASSIRHTAEKSRGTHYTIEPGIVDVGGRRLFMNCMGEGSPTVIFESGFGEGSIGWKEIQPAISTFTRACSYDRLGIGLSFPSLPTDIVRTTQDQVDDLVALLDTVGVEPPYVLVGHSIAGLNMLVFTGENPDWVEGLVLVDAAHPDQDRRFAEALDKYEPPPPPDSVYNEERLDFPASFAQAAQYTSYGDRPVAVLTAGIQLDEQFAAIWNDLQNEYATYSTNSRHIIAEKSGHFIMDNEPWVVIDSILWVLDEVQAVQTE